MMAVGRFARTCRVGCGVLGVLLSAAWSTPAGANTHATTIVLESHVRQRSNESAAAIAPVIDELAQLGFAALPGSIEKLVQGRMPRPGRLDEGRSLSDIKQLIDLGRGAFDKGKFADAETALRRAVELIRRNPALLVLDTNNEKMTYSAFVALSLTLSKLKRADDATAVMLELLRMTSTPIPQADYGPKAEDLHNAAEKQAQTLGRGTLAISVTDSRAMVFIDGQFRGIGKVAIGDLIPGTHYVFVQVPGTAGLQYVRAIQSNESSKLDVDWQLETMVHIAEPWAGIVFPTEADRAKEAVYARELAQRLGKIDVIVVGITQLNGVSYVVGTQYPANGDPPIGAFAPVNSGERVLRSLARYLFDGTVAAGLRVLPRASEGMSPSVALMRSEQQHRSTAIPWKPAFVGGVGVVAIAVGGVLYHNARPTSAIYTDAQARTIYTMAGGSILVGGGTYLWLRESGLTNARSAAFLGAGVAALASATELLLVDQDPSPKLPYSIRDTTMGGLVVGGAGIVLTGLGIWLWHAPGTVSTRSDNPQVTLVPSTGGARISYSRAF